MPNGAASESGHGEAKHTFYQNFHNPSPSLLKMYVQMQMANVLL
jgi:pyrroloquinoline quinone (PQQ) biosynthesis protein C